jgi:hypothetical protein
MSAPEASSPPRVEDASAAAAPTSYDASGPMPACKWPANLGPGNGGACTASRFFLACHAGDLTQLCTSNAPNACPNSGGGSCESRCAPNEYAIACGGPPGLPPPPGHPAPPAPPDNAPAGCRSAGITPGGLSFACCPCG